MTLLEAIIAAKIAGGNAPVPGGNVEQEQITAAVNEALAEAKASGEFDGKDGADGKDGQDGKDYVLTDADMTEIAETVKAEVPLVKTAEQPNFVSSVEEMTDPTKVYVLLSDGYFYKYTKKNGTIKKTLTVEDFGLGNMSVNGLPQTGVQRIYTTELLSLADGHVTSIGVSSPYNYIVYFYNTDSPEEANANTLSSDMTGKTTWNASNIDDIRKVACTTGTMDGATHFRVAFRNNNSTSNAGTIADMLEKVTMTHSSPGEVAGWVNTGFSYNQPADYEDRIVALEKAYGGLEYGTY